MLCVEVKPPPAWSLYPHQVYESIHFLCGTFFTTGLVMVFLFIRFITGTLELDSHHSVFRVWLLKCCCCHFICITSFIGQASSSCQTSVELYMKNAHHLYPHVFSKMVCRGSWRTLQMCIYSSVPTFLRPPSLPTCPLAILPSGTLILPPNSSRCSISQFILHQPS